MPPQSPGVFEPRPSNERDEVKLVPSAFNCPKTMSDSTGSAGVGALSAGSPANGRAGFVPGEKRTLVPELTLTIAVAGIVMFPVKTIGGLAVDVHVHVPLSGQPVAAQDA